MWDDPMVCEGCGYSQSVCHTCPTYFGRPFCCSECHHRPLPADVSNELVDPLFNSRTHGKLGTYASGCRGPLCKKSERDIAHQKYAAKRARLGKKPARSGLKDDEVRSRDDFLDAIQIWHEWHRATMKAAPESVRQEQEAV